MKHFYILLILVCLQGKTLSATIYVDATATGTNDGTSWANAYTSLAQGLVEANMHTTADSLLVAAGTYFPTIGSNLDDRDATFGIFRGGIRIFGGYPNGGGIRDFVVNPVFLDGGIGTNAITDNSYHVIVISGIAATADSIVIDGITVRNGVGNINTVNTLNGQSIKRSYGGGISVVNAANSISVRNCVVEDNRVTNTWVPVTNPNPTSPIQGFTDRGMGAGIYVKNGSLNLYSCQLKNNVSSGDGAALYLTQNVAMIEKCSFTGNKSESTAVCSSSSNTDFLNCTFTGNGPELAGWGSAVIYSWPGSNNVLSIKGCLIAQNDARALDGSVGTVTNCTVVNNDAGYGNNSSPSDPVLITNSILYGNFYNNVMTIPGENNVTVNYSLVGGGYNGTENLDAYPQFVDSTNGDFRLLAGSPAINAGSNTAAAGITEDLDGNARITNNYIDMGAYEFSGINSPASITWLNSENISVYPNPVVSVLNIESLQPVNAEIYSTEGKMFLQQENAVSIGMAEVPAGFYIINLYTSDGNILKSVRFVKQ